MGKTRVYEQTLHLSVLIYESKVAKGETSLLVLEAENQVVICDPTMAVSQVSGGPNQR